MAVKPPQLSAAEQAGLKDFHRLYEKHYDQINEELMKKLHTIPAMQRVVEKMEPAMLQAQQKQSRENIRRAIQEGVWEPLLQNNLDQGAAYAAMGVSFRDWFDIVTLFERTLVPLMVDELRSEPARLSAALVATSAYLDVAMSHIGEAYLNTKEKLIAQQRSSIEELSTPVLVIGPRLLLVPLIGVLDTDRARRLTEQLLQAVRTHRAKVVVIDITGVPAVDSKVANHIFQTVAAARLMGARSVVTGLTADVAQALVALGVDVDRLNTVGDLREGLEEARRLLGRPLIAGNGGDDDELVAVAGDGGAGANGQTRGAGKGASSGATS